MRTRVYYFNGYGVPSDILTDGNYHRYLMQGMYIIVKDMIFRAELELVSFFPVQYRMQPFVIYLAGGATNPLQPNKTEAGEMKRWFEHFFSNFVRVADFRIIDQPVDLQGSLEELSKLVGSQDVLTFFCEDARQDWMRYLAWQMFGNRAQLQPIEFDANQTVVSRLKQGFGLPPKIMGYHFPWFKKLVTDRLRRQHMKRAASV